MTAEPGASDDLAERTCHTARLGRKIVGVACDKLIVTAVSPGRHSREGGNPGGAWRAMTLVSRLRGNDGG